MDDKRKGTGKMSGQKKKCGAKSKRTGNPCKNIPMKNGKCRLHGGKQGEIKDKKAFAEKMSESSKGNKNNLKTGEFESIWGDVLDQEEIDFLQARKQHTVIAMIDEELAIITVRERRMLQRIDKLRDAGDFTLVEIETETGYGQRNYKRTNIQKEKRQGTIGQIQAIEDALTRVQDKKAKLLDLKFNIEKGEGPQDVSGIEKFMVALNGAAKHAWKDEVAPEHEVEVEEGDE